MATYSEPSGATTGVVTALPTDTGDPMAHNLGLDGLRAYSDQRDADPASRTNRDIGGWTMKVLIAGGAGYIGSTVASACSDAGVTPVILDSLVTGRREFTAGREFFEGDIADGTLIDGIFTEHPDIYAVIHCAALIVVPDSDLR